MIPHAARSSATPAATNGVGTQPLNRCTCGCGEFKCEQVPIRPSLRMQLQLCARMAHVSPSTPLFGPRLPPVTCHALIHLSIRAHLHALRQEHGRGGGRERGAVVAAVVANDHPRCRERVARVRLQQC